MQLARTVNFGNALEAPKEGDWGVTLQEEYFQLVKDAGFTAIRLPVKWSAHALTVAPYTVDPSFLARVDWAVSNAVSRGLTIIVNMHHYDELIANPATNLDRFLAIWKQLAEHYKTQGDRVFFELHNEPNGNLEPLWNSYAAQALAVVRQSNPTRPVIVGPNGWNSVSKLQDLQLPNDPNLIVTVHFYDPFSFTHQGAEWVTPSPPVGVSFPQPGASLSAPWQNWSWDSSVKGAGDTALEVTYQKGYAGFYAHQDAGFKNAQKLRFTTDRVVKLNVRCVEKNDNSGNSTPVTTEAGKAVEVPCAATVRDVMIQNASDSAQPAFTLKSLELVTASGAVSLIGNQKDSLSATLQIAADWGKANGRPIFVGEFGSYGKADMDSRVRWTAFIRDAIEKRGMSWGYWEFGAGFGVYDRTMKQWRAELLKALIP